jgi:hypothetical protein
MRTTSRPVHRYKTRQNSTEFVFIAWPFGNQTTEVLRNAIFENVTMTRQNADTGGNIMVEGMNNTLNEPNLRIKQVWTDGAYASHYQSVVDCFGYPLDIFFAGTGIGYRCSSLPSFLNPCILSLVAFYMDMLMSHRSGESFKGDKTTHDSLMLGSNSGYGVGRSIIFRRRCVA